MNIVFFFNLAQFLHTYLVCPKEPFFVIHSSIQVSIQIWGVAIKKCYSKIFIFRKNFRFDVFGKVKYSNTDISVTRAGLPNLRPAGRIRPAKPFYPAHDGSLKLFKCWPTWKGIIFFLN